MQSLKAKNAPWIWSVVVADCAAIALLGFNIGIDDIPPDLKRVPQLAGAAIVPILVNLLTSLIPSGWKDVIVFWRIRDPLPGSRAFSVFAHKDPRIDFGRLEAAEGPFPTVPSEQNSHWFRLYKSVQDDLVVAHPHGLFLLFRDISCLSLILLPCAVAVILIYGEATTEIPFVAALFIAQYALTMVAARNNAIRMVKSVLALHC